MEGWDNSNYTINHNFYYLSPFSLSSVQLTEDTTSVIEIVVIAEDGLSTKTYTISI